MIRQRWLDELDNCCGFVQRPPLKPRTAIDKHWDEQINEDLAIDRTLERLEQI